MTRAEYRQLESRLEMMIFAMETAVGQGPDKHFCRVCRRLRLVLGYRFADEEWFKWRHFGTWAAIQG